MSNNALRFELPAIRPPSESMSLLIRVTRNCPWNRCTFCYGTLYDRRKFEISAFELDEVYWGTGYTIEEAVKELAQKLALGNPAFKEFT